MFLSLRFWVKWIHSDSQKYQITSLKPCKVKPNRKNLNKGKGVQFALLILPQKYMSYGKSLRWRIIILWTSFLKVEAGKDFINKSAKLSLDLIYLISIFFLRLKLMSIKELWWDMFCFVPFNIVSSKLSDAGGIIFKQYYWTIYLQSHIYSWLA